MKRSNLLNYGHLTACLIAVATLFACLITSDRAGASVGLADFRATAQGDAGVLVFWETATEFETIAFTLSRSQSPSGPWGDTINQQAARGGVSGATYTFLDTQVVPGTRYYYLLTEISSGGATSTFGPVSAGIGLAEPATATASPTATATQYNPIASTPTPTPTRTMTPTITPTVTQTPFGTPTYDPNPGHPTATRQYTNTPLPFPSPTATPWMPPTEPPVVVQPPPLSGPVVLTTPTTDPAIPLPSLLAPMDPMATFAPGFPTIGVPPTLPPSVTPTFEQEGIATPLSTPMTSSAPSTPVVFGARQTAAPVLGTARPRATATAAPKTGVLGDVSPLVFVTAGAALLVVALGAAGLLLRRGRRP